MPAVKPKRDMKRPPASGPDVLTLRQINRATLARQMLLARERVTALTAVERLVAVQAQWPRPPFLGLWSRVEGFRRGDLAALLLSHKVVRATLLRGTLHLCTAADFAALRPAVQPLLDAAVQIILKDRAQGLDIPKLVAQARTVLAAEPCTFEVLRDHFARAHPKLDERAMGYAVRMALPMVQVPTAADAWAFPANACFALAEEWIGKKIAPAPARPDALVLRYLAAYGPSSVADVQAWSGLPRLRDTLEALRPKLRVFRDEGRRELFDLPDAPRPEADVPAPVRLVADYDNVIGTRADERFVARAHRPRVFLSALRLAATVLVDGFVAGTWKLERKKDVATVTVDAFAPFAPRVKKEVIAEAEALLRFAEPEAGKHVVRA
jgi:hypothetical protein